MASPLCACGLPKPSATSFKAAETSASRRDSRTLFLNRPDSSMEIIFAPGERGQFTAPPRRFEFRGDALFRRCHLLRRHPVFLKGVIGGNHLHRAQRHNPALNHKANVFPLRRFFQPVAQPPASLRYGQSLHTLIIMHTGSPARTFSPSLSGPP